MENKCFYVTTAANMPHGSGYWLVFATDEDEARRLAHRHCPEGRWSFMYTERDEVHPLDRKCHGYIGGPPPWPQDEAKP